MDGNAERERSQDQCSAMHRISSLPGLSFGTGLE
jgi:hypothetical protein